MTEAARRTAAPPDHAIIGFGELGTTWGAALVRAGVPRVTGYAPERDDERGRRALDERFARAGVHRAPSVADAVHRAGVVVAAVPASAAAAVAEASSPHLAPGALYVDVSAAVPDVKLACAEVIGRGDGQYVDAAVTGTVVSDGLAVPVLASGPGAHEWAELGARLGMRIRALDAPAGHAALVKLLRSVYTKGRDALVLEMLLAAGRHGVADLVVESMPETERGSFAALADRVLPSVALHAERRAAELEAAGQALEAVGVDPLVTAAAEQRLRRAADLALRALCAGRRPAGAAEVLALIEQLTDDDGAQTPAQNR